MKTVSQIRSQAAQHRNPWLFHPEKDMVENASVGRMRTVTEAQLKNAKLSGLGKDRRRERKLKVKSLFHSANTQTGTLGWKKIVQSENSPQINECIVLFAIKKAL